MLYDVIVVGAGPAGMMASIEAAKRGLSCALLDSNSRLGEKLLITGGGRCNFTNNREPKEFLERVVKNPKFLYKAINAFTPRDAISFFKSNSMDYSIEEAGRVFPSSHSSKDVVDTLMSVLREYGVDILLSRKVIDFTEDTKTNDGEVIYSLSLSNKEIIIGRSLILATGGLSFPKTGSDGSVLRLLRSKGVKISPFYPCLCSLSLNCPFITDNPGISLENVRLSTIGKPKIEKSGSVVFTHKGISGPCAINFSSYITEIYNREGGIEIFIDLACGHGDDNLRKNIFSSKSAVKGLSEVLPTALVKSIFEYLKIDDKRPDEISKKDINRIIETIKRFRVKLTSIGSIEHSVTTRGGIDVKCIDPKTMRLKGFKNISVCGDMIDYDCETGGFNIQAALSTGYIAGRHILS